MWRQVAGLNRPLIWLCSASPKPWFWGVFLYGRAVMLLDLLEVSYSSQLLCRLAFEELMEGFSYPLLWTVRFCFSKLCRIEFDIGYSLVTLQVDGRRQAYWFLSVHLLLGFFLSFLRSSLLTASFVTLSTCWSQCRVTSDPFVVWCLWMAQCVVGPEKQLTLPLHAQCQLSRSWGCSTTTAKVKQNAFPLPTTFYLINLAKLIFVWSYAVMLSVV